ncbi:MAG: UDP-glucose:undecaprenyl-phosphate glucose-1-phosphate transferase [Anaerolineales bacterium]|nr:UDP-glucose:undecaprenyl-phosphate glucose-1-phosphate transferase [Anaerolineales bacterium]
MTRRERVLFVGLQVFLDVAMVVLAFLAAYRLWLAFPLRPIIEMAPLRQYLVMLGVQVFVTLVVFFFYKRYHRTRIISYFDEVSQVFAGVSIATVTTVALTSFFFKNSALEVDYSRGMVVYAWGLTIVFVMVGRVVYGAATGMLRSRGIGRERVLIVGAGDVGQQMVRRAQMSPELGYDIVGFVDDVLGRERVQGVRVLGTTDNLADIIDGYGISEVIIALPEANQNELLRLTDRCQDKGVTIQVFPSVFQIMASEVRLGDLNGLPLLTVRDSALRGWKLSLKRTVDVVVAGITLVVLSPLMLLLALLVKLDSSGPAFYIQKRMGLDASPFPMIKFRTMRQDAEAETGPIWATADDPRRTRLGAFLRKTSLDELPQFVNVLLGEMSVVGPRPERPVFVEEFRQQIPRYMYRHREKAGITGWAQVNGLRGDTSIEERTKYDLWYTENWSLWLDFKIILKTFIQVFRDRNAY